MVASSRIQKSSCNLQTPPPSSPYLHHSPSSFFLPCNKTAECLEAKIPRIEFVFSRIHLKNHFTGNHTGVMATCLSSFSQFQCMVSKKSASITINHFCIFSISVHLFQNLFHGEMHMGDGNLPKQFQPIPMHGFWEIDLWNLQPFSIFLEICASIDHNFSMGGA